MKKHIEIIERMMFAMANHTVDGKRIFPTLKAAKEALKKQMPKKPLNPCGRWMGKAKGGNCPICGSHTTSNVSNFCRKCGQALDWSDTE